MKQTSHSSHPKQKDLLCSAGGQEFDNHSGLPGCDSSFPFLIHLNFPRHLRKLFLSKPKQHSTSQPPH